MHSTIQRFALIKIYEDWRNNYLTYEKYAEHNEITTEEATALIAVARSVFNSKNPNQ